jgi:hypothetical protein
MSTSIVPVLSRGFGGNNPDDLVEPPKIQTDSVGNVFMCGSFKGFIDFNNGISLNGSPDILLGYFVKYNSDGIAVKAIKFDSTELVYCSSLVLDTLGNVYVVGYFIKDITFNGLPTLTTSAIAGYMVKLDNSLTPIKAIKFDSTDTAICGNLVLDTLGNVYVVGYFSKDITFDGLPTLTTNANNNVGYMVKVDNSLTPIKAIKFDSTDIAFCASLVLDTLGNVYAVGSFGEDITFNGLPTLTTNANVSAGYMVKLDNSLTPIKAIKFDSTNRVICSSLVSDTFGNVYVTGLFGKKIDFGNEKILTNNLDLSIFSPLGEGYVVKLNKDLVAQKAIPINTTDSNSSGNEILIDRNNNLYLLGDFNGDIDFNGLMPLSGTINEAYGYIAVLTNELVAQQSMAFTTTFAAYTSSLALFGNILYACGDFNTDISFGDKFPLTTSSFYSGYFVKFNIITTTTTTTTTEPICLPAGTPILTDQGLVPIDKIDTTIHTINNKRIIAITKTITPEKHLVCFEKYTLGLNIPSQRTLMTPGHEVLYRGKLVQAKEFVGRIKNVYTVPYNGDVLYNVLQEKHGLMKVNNMVLETLNPINKVAKKILSEL